MDILIKENYRSDLKLEDKIMYSEKAIDYATITRVFFAL